MNREMLAHPATQRNVAQLVADGARILGPDSGAQACGEVGDGRMLEAAALFEAVGAHFQPKVLRGKRVLVTAGPTFEPIDPVRGITNLQRQDGLCHRRAVPKGRRGHADRPRRGATPAGVQRIDMQTPSRCTGRAAHRRPARRLYRHGRCGRLAARRRACAQDQKAEDGITAPQIAMTENPDIPRAVAQLPQPPYCVGFAAETESSPSTPRPSAAARASR